MGDFERVKENASLREYAAAHLVKAGSERDKYVCPVCGSGTGKNKSAAFSIMPDGMRAKCFSCQWNGDIYDLAGLVNDTTDKAEQLRAVASWAGIGIEGEPRGFKETMNARAARSDSPTAMRWDDSIGGDSKAKRDARRAEEAAGAEPGTATDGGGNEGEPAGGYTEGRERHRRYIAECAARLSDGYIAYLNDAPEDKAYTAVADYLETRGIGVDEACALGIGYDPKPAHGWQDEAGTWHNTPRLVLPWLGCDYYHIDRAIDERAHNLKYDKPKADEVGEQPVYNPDAFSQDYVIAVEGVLDAIAIQLCGYNAVALGGTAVNDFATEAAARSYSGVVIDMLDCDGHSDADNPGQRKGRGAGADLVSLLGEADITTLARAEYGIDEADDYGGHKDAGEWLADNRDDLADMLEVMAGMARDKAQRAKDGEYREAMRQLSVKDPASVARDVLELRDVYEPVPTGIKALDEALGGGVSLGETTFFGAVSSYGKTTFALQVADYMAAHGRSVLFVTIEQSARELVAKSLSRLVYTENVTGWNIATPQEIISLRARKAWGDGQRAALAKAVDDYNRMIAPNLRILEGNKQPSVIDIRAVASKMKEHDGQAPIIFCDYLQLLSPLSERYDTDKRNADMNVSELRKMARDLVTHVWCISSLNRSSYSGIISLDSFKESGGIEYGADNLLGLQPFKMAEQLEGVSDSKMKRTADKLIRENKSKTERDCELVILKQRNGALPDEPLPLTFKPMSALFLEPGRAAAQERAVKRR